MKNELEIN